MNKNTPVYFTYSYCLVLLSVLVLAVYRQVIHFDFISLDDNLFIFQNPYIRDGFTWAALKWAWSADLFFQTPYVDYWQPITVMSRLLDVQLYGMNPAGHHFMNLLLHWINTLLVFALIVRMTKSKLSAIVVACFFAVHPLSVEAVAWATARKDLLSSFFVLLCMYAYVFAVTEKQLRFYVYSFIFFVLALMSKPAMIFLPLWLLVLDYWPLGRTQTTALIKLVREKILFLIGSAAMLIVTVVLPLDKESSIWSYGVAASFWSYPLRIGEQLYRFFVPLDLNIYQSHDAPALLSLPTVALSMMTIAVLSGLFFYLRRQAPYLLAGWLFFLIGIAPSVSRLWSANRFMYLPIIGLAIIIGYGLSGKSRIVGWVVALWITCLGGLSFYQTSHWRNDFTLFSHTLKINPHNTKAHYILGTRYYAAGQWQKALTHFKAAFEVLDAPAARAGAAEWMIKTYLQMGDEKSASFYMKWVEELKAEVYKNVDNG